MMGVRLISVPNDSASEEKNVKLFKQLSHKGFGYLSKCHQRKMEVNPLKINRPNEDRLVGEQVLSESAVFVR